MAEDFESKDFATENVMAVTSEISEQLLVFTRYPQPGQTKTRLIPCLGAEKAAELQRFLTEQTLRQVDALNSLHPVAIAIYYTGGDRLGMEEWLGQERTYRLQSEGDLGDRMEQAFQDAFDAGKNKVVVIGIDCLQLTAEILRSAFQGLEQSDVVLGPAEDGGYYLLGMRRLIPELFRAMPWSCDRVFGITYQRVQDLQLTCGLLPTLQDCDRPEDLSLLRQINPALLEDCAMGNELDHP